MSVPVKAPAAPFSWTGWYIGLNEGGALDKSRIADPFVDPIFGTTQVFSDRVRSTGSFMGGQIGYNYQVNSTVYGIEADLHWADLRGTNTCFAAGGFFLASNCEVRTD